MDQQKKQAIEDSKPKAVKMQDVILNTATGVFAPPAAFKVNTDLTTVTVVNDGAVAIDISGFQVWSSAVTPVAISGWTASNAGVVVGANIVTDTTTLTGSKVSVVAGASLVMTTGTTTKISTMSAVVLFANFTASTGGLTMIFGNGDGEICRMSLPAGKHMYRVSFDDSEMGDQSGVNSPDFTLITAGATKDDADWDAGGSTYAVPSKLIPKDPKWDFYDHSATSQKFVPQLTTLVGTQRSVPIANLDLPVYKMELFAPNA